MPKQGQLGKRIPSKAKEEKRKSEEEARFVRSCDKEKTTSRGATNIIRTYYRDVTNKRKPEISKWTVLGSCS